MWSFQFDICYSVSPEFTNRGGKSVHHMFFLLKSDVNVLLSSSLLLYLCVMKTINARENIRLSRTKFHCLKLSGNLYLSGKLEILSLF